VFRHEKMVANKENEFLFALDLPPQPVGDITATRAPSSAVLTRVLFTDIVNETRQGRARQAW